MSTGVSGRGFAGTPPLKPFPATADGLGGYANDLEELTLQDQRTPRRRTRTATLALAIVAMLALANSPARATVAPAAAHPARASTGLRVQVGSDAWELFKLTNASRGRFGLPSLRLNRDMSLLARRHSAAMARAGDLFHTSNVDVYLQGIDWRAWGENIGYTPGGVTGLQTAFMRSPPHRENILNRAFRNVAIGTVRANGTLWVTVFFYG